MIIFGVALTLDRRADLIADKFEGSRAQDVLLVPARVLVEDLLLIDQGEGVGERRQKRAGCELEVEDNSGRIGASTASTISYQLARGLRTSLGG